MRKIPVDNSGLICKLHGKNYKPKDEQDFNRILPSPGTNLSCEDDRWHTCTKDAFTVPQLEKIQNIGRRRDLIRSIINERVLKKLQTPEVIADDGCNPSEYNDKFCDPTFTPFLDKPFADEKILTKYPLYVCNNHTFYKALVEKGALKSRSEISNINEPFRKNCTFTTAPDVALREPTGGF